MNELEMIEQNNKNELLLNAKLASFAYLDTFGYKHIGDQCCIHLNIMKITKKETGCVWIFNNEFNNIYIAFRGTASLKEAINNVKMAPTPFYNNLGSVHSGYFDYYKQFRNELIELIFKLKTKNKLNNISIAGHSAAACVSELLALDLAFLLKENVTSYAYGSLPVADCQFAENFRKQKNLKSYRVMHEHDFVSKIPTPFIHVQRKPIIIREKIKQKAIIVPSTILKYHSMERYIQGIKKLI